MMDNSSVKLYSNWSQIGGCALYQAVQIKSADPDSFVRPSLDEVVIEEKSILFSKVETLEYCELCVQLHPHYKIQAVSLVCNAAKIEIFQGPIKEYMETIYGITLDETDDQFESYRYDVEIQKSGITELTLKFLTHSKEVCIFGIMLHTAPNPNGITTLSPNTACINVENVHNMLQYSKEHAPQHSENFRKLQELMKKAGTYSQRTNIIDNANTTSTSILGKKFEEKTDIVNKEPLSDGNISNKNIIVNELKSHIDGRFQELEQRIIKHLEGMEIRQMEKLENMVNVLEKFKK